MDTNTISWHSYDHQHEKKDPDWFWALGTIAISASITSIIFGNVLFAILIIVASFTIGLFATKDPDMVEFVLSNRGLLVNETMYSYTTILAFWLEKDENSEKTTLIVDTSRFMSPHLVIPIEEPINPNEIRKMFIKNAVEEKELYEPFSYKLFELLGL